MPDHAVRRLLLLVAVLLLAACGDGAVVVPTPPAIALEIGLEGAAQATQKLALDPTLKPTFSEGNLHAWSLQTLFGAAARTQGARLEVYDHDDTMTLLERPFKAADGLVWVVRRNKKDEAQLALVDPADPFPDFHGRGGNRGRARDAAHRIRSVRRLRLVFYTVDQPETAPAVDGKQQMVLQLTVTVDGKARTFTQEDLAGLEALAVEGDSGKGTRDAWSVRALASALGGAAARVTEVQGRGGRTLVIHADDWSSASKVPLLRLNRRGQFKFHWADKDLQPTTEPDLRDVSGLVLVTR